jgi:glycerol uptake facilitator-like aquaporin
MDRGLPAALAELVATTLLVFLVAGSLVVDELLGGGGYGVLGVAIVAGAAYALACAVARRAGPGYANPAVTLAAYLVGRLGVERAGLVVLAQLVGGVLGAAFAVSLLPAAAVEAAGHGAARVAQGTGPLASVTLELVATLALALPALALLRDDEPDGLGPAAVGLGALTGTVVALPVTGAALNPARALGPLVFAGGWTGAWVHVVGPVLGAALAAAVQDGLVEDAPDEAA